MHQSPLVHGMLEYSTGCKVQEMNIFLYEYNSLLILFMLFAVINSPLFIKIVAKIPFDDLIFVTVYIKGIYVKAENWETILMHLDIVLGRLLWVGSKLKLKKFTFVKPESAILGHVVDVRTGRTDTAKIRAI